MPNISRKDFLKIAGTGVAGSVMACSCAPRPSPIPTMTPSLEIPTPTETAVPTIVPTILPTILLPDKIAYICGCKPDSQDPSGGKDYSLYIGNYCTKSERFLMHWDLSGLPSKVKINKAVMGLYCVDLNGTPSGNMVYAPLNSDWGETVTYNTQPKNDSSKQVRMDWPAKAQWMEVDITNLVNQWLATPENNHGLIGYAVDISEDSFYAVFASIQMPEGIRPKLTIT